VSYLVHLVVAVPEAFILGNGEYHIEEGSTISLVCIIEKVRNEMTATRLKSHEI